MGDPQMGYPQIDDACADDVPALAELLREGTCGYTDLLYEGLPLEARLQRRSKVTSFENYVVARSGGRVVGMATAYPIDAARAEGPDPAIPGDRLAYLAPFRDSFVPGSYYLQALAVARPCRSRGIGTRLVRAVCERGAVAGLATLSLHVFAANPAVRLYRRLGMTVIAARPSVAHPRLTYDGEVLLMAGPID